MTKAALEGLEVIIVVSDPWEFGTAHGSGPFLATVLQVGPKHWDSGTDAILLRLETPLVYEGITCEYFIASPRLDGGDIKALARGTEVDCTLTRIPADRAMSANPFDLSWWRGGIGLVGSLRSCRG
jgi:hypothetical protein